MIDARADFEHLARADISVPDLSTIERLLSKIDDNTRSLVSSNVGGDIRAVVNRLDETNHQVNVFANDTRKRGVN